MQVGELRLELHRVFLFALPEPTLSVAVLLLAPRDLPEALGVEHLVVVFAGRSHYDRHEIRKPSDKGYGAGERLDD